MSVVQVESMALLSSDICYDILGRLDGTTLASAACACSTFSSISKEEKLWENACASMWPSTSREEVKSLILSLGGFKKFYADCFPIIINKQVPELQLSGYSECPEEWNDAEFYGDIDESEYRPSDFVFIVDVKYKEKIICSKVLWGIPNANESNDWFCSCPFRVDLAGDDAHANELMLLASDGLPLLVSLERERNYGKVWQELCNGIRLSWIVINKKIKQAANLSSWCPLGGQRHWPTENDFVLRFGSLLSAKDILPCQVVECILSMKFHFTYSEGGNTPTSLKLSELSMQLGDMDGAHVNGRNSLLVLKEALSCCRSKNYREVLESCRTYSRVQSELKEVKVRNENRLDNLFIIVGIAVCMMVYYHFRLTFCYYFW